MQLNQSVKLKSFEDEFELEEHGKTPNIPAVPRWELKPPTEQIFVEFRKACWQIITYDAVDKSKDFAFFYGVILSIFRSKKDLFETSDEVLCYIAKS